MYEVRYEGKRFCEPVSPVRASCGEIARNLIPTTTLPQLWRKNSEGGAGREGFGGVFQVHVVVGSFAKIPSQAVSPQVS